MVSADRLPSAMLPALEEYNLLKSKHHEFRSNRLKFRQSTLAASDAIAEHPSNDKLEELAFRYKEQARKFVKLESARLLFQKTIDGVPQLLREPQALEQEEKLEALIKRQKAEFFELQSKLESAATKMMSIQNAQDKLDDSTRNLDELLELTASSFTKFQEAEKRRSELHSEESQAAQMKVEVAELRQRKEQMLVQIEQVKERIAQSTATEQLLSSEIADKLQPKAEKLAELLEDKKLCYEFRDMAAETEIPHYRKTALQFEQTFLVDPPVFQEDEQNRPCLTLRFNVDPALLGSSSARRGEHDALVARSATLIPPENFVITLVFANSECTELASVIVKDHEHLSFDATPMKDKSGTSTTQTIQTAIFTTLTTLYSIYS